MGKLEVDNAMIPQLLGIKVYLFSSCGLSCALQYVPHVTKDTPMCTAFEIDYFSLAVPIAIRGVAPGTTPLPGIGAPQGVFIPGNNYRMVSQHRS